MKIKEFIKHMTSSHKSATEYYGTMNYDIVPGLNGWNQKARWMNVGYWKGCSNYNQACEKLAYLLSVKGKFSSKDKLLDVGCGCGEQDYYWAKKYEGISIFAMDLVEKQIEEAIQRMPEIGRSHIDFRTGDAGNIPFEAESFTRVSALDCEYHFDTREKFYKEAYRVLEKNGMLVVSDMLPAQGEKWNGWLQNQWRKGIFIPEENMYSYQQCVKVLKDIGFRKIRVKVISQEVFTGLAWYFIRRFLSPNKNIDEVEIKLRNKSFKSRLYPAIWGFLFGTSEYVVITAEK